MPSAPRYTRLSRKIHVFMQAAPQPSAVIRFGVFEADVRSGELRKNGVKVKIQDLPFRALKLMLSRPNEVLSRDEFRQALWPEDVFVDFDHGISSAINRLRDALGDSADNPIFIETVERRGYRWIVPTHHPAPQTPTRPVLVQTEIEKAPQETTELSPSWRWALVFPLIALAFAIWGFRPFHRSAKAAANVPAMKSSNPENHSHIDAEAQQFYLKGRFYWEKRTPDALNKALDSFTQSIVHDPNYAPAYVGLADCYNLLREYTLMPASEAYPRALAAAKKAVELDDQSSEAHASLAFALFYGMWDAPHAEREFRRAIELNPNNAVAHHWYATYLSAVGRNLESLTEIERAQTLEPASKAVLADKGDLLLLAGRRDEAISLLKQLEATEPDFVSPHRYLEGAYFESGDYPAYLEEWRKEATLLHDNPTLKLVDAAERGYHAGGTTRMLHTMLVVQSKLYERGQFSPYLLAQTCASLGKKQEALRYLAIAYDKHDEHIIGVKGDPELASLKDEPAYQALVAKFNFSPAKEN